MFLKPANPNTENGFKNQKCPLKKNLYSFSFQNFIDVLPKSHRVRENELDIEIYV